MNQTPVLPIVVIRNRLKDQQKSWQVYRQLVLRIVSCNDLESREAVPRQNSVRAGNQQLAQFPQSQDLL